METLLALIEKLNIIFTTETFETYSEDEVIKYEELYKQEVEEELADYIDSLDIEDYEKEELETSKLIEYNPNNLVFYYKNN
jgi:hypothetical protein